ncbi:hypothetical protein HHK36_026284 [Tetracentron sinense]|uniref:Uncharacterized protein n=1 Tax=Tetracentron sinense TaxID=13715 RepID=A0A835D2H2_TETSI|nr:hypothetical protein HHK36_026284 [Tetracentron sinense]
MDLQRIKRCPFHIINWITQMMSTFIAFTFLFTTISFSTTFAVSDNASASTVLHRTCGHTQAANPQSFDVNFVDAMEIISRKVAEAGFGIAASGDNASDRVYGLGQCLNYLSNINCRLCYAESRVKLPLCLPATAARVYVDGCFLRYGDYNFSQEIIDSSDTSICGSSINVSDKIQFREITTGLIQNLTLEASEEREYYKLGNDSVSSGVSVYGIAQCWRSLNKSGCKECLESARKRVVGCLPGSDGRALNAGCFVKYSTEPFYVKAPPSSSGSSSVVHRRLKVALGSIFAAVVVIGGAILWGRRGSSGGADDMNGSSEILRSISESHLSFKYDDLRKATNDFDLGNKIGQGGYGSVYKGILADGREIAVKRLFFNTTQWVDQFFNEVNLISRVQHKNLVKLLGCSVEGPESLLVYEYLCNTSIDQGYMAPEYVIHGQLTEKADVYSYGVLVLEVLTGRKNTSSFSNFEGHSLLSQIWGHFTSKTLIEILDPLLQGQCFEEQVLKVFHVGLLCTQASPSLRPPMWKVVEMLTSTARDLPLPSQPPFINIKGVEDRSGDSYMLSSSKSRTSVNQMSVSIMRGR